MKNNLKKDIKNILIAIAAIIVLWHPVLLVLAIVGYIIYLNKKGGKFSTTLSKMKETYKNSDKTHNYEVIDTSAEVIESKVVDNKDEWNVIKEYKH